MHIYYKLIWQTWRETLLTSDNICTPISQITSVPRPWCRRDPCTRLLISLPSALCAMFTHASCVLSIFTHASCACCQYSRMHHVRAVSIHACIMCVLAIFTHTSCACWQLLWTLDCILYFISYKFESRSFLVSTEVTRGVVVVGRYQHVLD